MKYNRIVLKISGEALAPAGAGGIEAAALKPVIEQIGSIARQSVQIAMVVGGGNLWRGAGKEMDRVTADYIGMMATVMNALALNEMFKAGGFASVVLSSFVIPQVTEFYRKSVAVDYLKKNVIVICAGGTGNPFFTTDTTAALRAAELEADVLLKATQVDGVYDADPKTNPSASRYDVLNFDEALRKNLKIMDMTAFSLCRDNRIPVIIFDFYKKGNLIRVLQGDKVGTLVSSL